MSGQYLPCWFEVEWTGESIASPRFERSRVLAWVGMKIADIWDSRTNPFHQFGYFQWIPLLSAVLGQSHLFLCSKVHYRQSPRNGFPCPQDSTRINHCYRSRKFRMFRRKSALWSALISACENSIEVITDIRHILNWNNKIIEIQIIISIVRVSEHFSKMLVLSGVFNTTILDAPKLR
jgi:hypothetical protein